MLPLLCLALFMETIILPMTSIGVFKQVIVFCKLQTEIIYVDEGSNRFDNIETIF